MAATTRAQPAANDPLRDGVGPRACTATLLTAVAGFVDAVGYLLLAHLFVANMSGNSVAAGLQAAEGHWREAAYRGYPVVTFVVGLIVGGVVAHAGRRRWGAGNVVSLALLLEAGLLGVFTSCGVIAFGRHPSESAQPSAAWQAAMVALAAIAMGIQNVTLRAAGTLNVYTTHVTGSLTQLADEAVQLGIWLHNRLTRSPPPFARRWRRLVRVAPHHPPFRWFLLHLALWTAYVAGAAAGALALVHYGVMAMALPAVALLLVALARYTFAITPAR